MVPNISPNGSSFRGAGAYHLHDKPTATESRPRTALRVLFMVTRNLANDDARAALDEMWRTAEDATYLKAAGGASQRGRKNDTPVKTISLAWAPGQTPTRDQMIAAADDFLNAMGWHQHQAVYAAHSDTAHPHLHIILNRVHPQTGRTLNDWQERRRSQIWALTYERQHGGVLCAGRALRHDINATSPTCALPHPHAKLLRQHPRRIRLAVAEAVRTQLRPAWALHYRLRPRALAELALTARIAGRVAASLAREGDTASAIAALDRFERRRATALHTLAARGAAIRTAQVRALRMHVRATLMACHISPNAAHLAAANDNSSRLLPPKAPPRHNTAVRSRAIAGPAKTPGNPLRQLGAMLRSERQRLRAMQAAAYAALGMGGSAARSASALAHSEIALAFASRWAAIEHTPAALRASAIAALRAEQAAALSARLGYHLARLSSAQRAERLALSGQHAAARRVLSQRHKQAWAAAAATIKAFRPVRAPPPARGRGTALTGTHP